MTDELTSELTRRLRSSRAEQRPAPSIGRHYTRDSDAQFGSAAGEQLLELFAALPAAPRLSDPVLDCHARAAHAAAAYAVTYRDILAQIEELFDEPSESGIGQRLIDFWLAWAMLAHDPGSAELRRGVMDSGAVVAHSFNAASVAMAEFQSAIDAELGRVATSIAEAATALAAVNARLAAPGHSQSLSGLRDERDGLLMTISELCGAVIVLSSDGQAGVSLSGRDLVAGAAVTSVTVTAGALIIDGVAVETLGGLALALSDARNDTIPYYVSGLDAIVAELAMSVNEIHRDGFDITGARASDFFGTGDSGAAGKPSTAAELRVILDNDMAVAVAGAAGGGVDGMPALCVADLSVLRHGVDVSYRALITSLGQAVSRAGQASTIALTGAGSVDTLRNAASGSDLDEDASKLVAYQRHYRTAGRVLKDVESTLSSIASPDPGGIGFVKSQPHLSEAAVLAGIPRATHLASMRNQLATGRRISKPSDSPGGTATLMWLSRELGRAQQLHANASFAASVLEVADAAMTDVLSILDRARVLLSTGPGHQSIPDAIRQLRAELLGLANASYLGRPVFGGSTSGSVAFGPVATVDGSVDGSDTSIRYRGNSIPLRTRLATEHFEQFSWPGVAVFGPDSRNVFDVFADIADKQYQESERDRRTAELDATRRRVRESVRAARASVHRVRQARVGAAARVAALQVQLQPLARVDVADVAAEVSNAEVAYEAALSTHAVAAQLSLIQFLS